MPKEVFEDELIPLFEKCGKIWDLRLMMDPLTGSSRGFCFVMFTERAAAQEAVKQVGISNCLLLFTLPFEGSSQMINVILRDKECLFFIRCLFHSGPFYTGVCEWLFRPPLL